MKTGMILATLAALSLTASASAMEMMDSGTMMAKDTMMTGSMDKSMMKDTMMHSDKMMMSDSKMMMKKYVRMSTASLAKSLGYTWSTDRAMLAEKAGVTEYKGTVRQNLQIRTYLMGMMKEKMAMMKDGTMTK
jgi:hypothetical protein